MRSTHISGGQKTLASVLSLFMMALAVVLFGLSSSAVLAQDKDTETGYTDSYRLQDCEFIDEGENTYFILRPGYQLIFEGEEDGENVLFTFEVLDETRMFHLPEIGWVSTRVIEEKEWADGRPVEFTRGFFTLDAKTGNLYDFGDEVDIYNDEGTEVESNDGTWHAGRPDENGLAWPGVFMPGSIMLGAKYYQQMAEGMSMERGHNVEMGLTITTPAGTFKDCIKVRETNWSEPHGAESFKTHAPGVGLIGEDTLQLTAYGYNIFDTVTGKLKPQYKGEILPIKTAKK
ncbi:hypothetical protein MJD09_00810 [bacterium]|nr:hypothetical protein [bacterium]